MEEKVALARDFSKAVLPLLSSERIKLVMDRTFHFSEVAEAHRYMESNASRRKIVLTW